MSNKPSPHAFSLQRLAVWLSFSILLFGLTGRSFSQSANLPIEHWAYRFIDRLETRGLFVSEDFNMRPYSRDAFADIIAQINAVLQAETGRLSAAETGLFEQLKGEFSEELQSRAPDVPVDESEHEPHIYSWHTDEARVHFNASFGQQFHFESKTDVDAGIPKSITTIGFGGRARLRGGMIIHTSGFSRILSGTDSLTNTIFNPSLGLPVTEKALFDLTVSDGATAYLVFRLPWFDLELGRDLVDWGPSSRGALLVSRNSNVYDMVKMTFRYKRAKYEYLHGFLNAAEAKYLVAHRLEIRPTRNLLLSLSESIVYGDRDVEPIYLNPFIPFLIAERHAGNRDNNMLAVDATWFVPGPRMKFYAELLGDDVSFAKDIFGSWGNKWGVMAGWYWVDPFGLADTDLRLEAVRLQPFVYSHRTPINTHSNYNGSIGHWLGPDADDLFVEFAHQPHRNLRWSVSWEHRRRAQNDINFGTRPADGRTTFLGGVVETVRHYGLAMEWQMRRDWLLSASYQYLQSDNLRRDELADQNNHRLFLRFSANY